MEATSNDIELYFAGFFLSIAHDHLPHTGSPGGDGVDEDEAVDPGMSEVVITGGCIAGRVGVEGSDDPGFSGLSDVPDLFHAAW